GQLARADTDTVEVGGVGSGQELPVILSLAGRQQMQRAIDLGTELPESFIVYKVPGDQGTQAWLAVLVVADVAHGQDQRHAADYDQLSARSLAVVVVQQAPDQFEDAIAQPCMAVGGRCVEGEQIRQVRRQPLFDLNVLLQIEDDHEVEVDPAQCFRVHMLAREVRLLAAQQFIALVPLGIALYQIEIARKRMREQYLQM